MTWYREINPIQEPFDMRLDDSGRAQVAFNIAVIKNPSDTLLEEITKILTDASVGVANVTIFESSKKDLPVGDNAFIVITETGGVFPEWIHNEDTPAFQRPSAQINARASSYADARTMARAAYVALVAVQNQTVIS